MYDFFVKVKKRIDQKGVLSFGFSEKHRSEVNKFWGAAKQGYHFSMILKFCKQVLILSKSTENF